METPNAVFKDKKQAIGAKVYSQEGNSPDHLLRLQRNG